MRWLLVIATVVAGGCRYAGTYACERDDQCRSRAAPGTCQLPAGRCAFPDATCSMGQRYDDTAGDLAGECVGGTSAVDASTVDASTEFDPMACPTNFMAINFAITSRYRVLPALTAVDKFPAYIAACEAQQPGFTHAVSIDSAGEAMALATVLGSSAGQRYIGAIQDPAATRPGDGWINIDGSPLVASQWAVSQGQQPDDADNIEEDHHEQAGAFDGAGIHDVGGKLQLPVICECDGKAVSPMFRAFLQATVFN